jgi:diguanylate cyclase (GGDEF)-like protein
MAQIDPKNPPSCTIDFPLEFSSEEIGRLVQPINTLLKTGYLLGNSLDTEITFYSLFDIAEEIAGVEACGLLSRPEDHPDDWELRLGRPWIPEPSRALAALLTTPGILVQHFNKPLLLDPAQYTVVESVCDAWSSRSLVVFPLQRDRETVAAMVFGKHSSHPFTPAQVKILWVLAMQAESHIQQRGSMKAFPFYAFLDPLTHLYNRRYFENQLEREIPRSRRSGESFCLLLLDLDCFRTYNQRVPTSARDMALQEFASLLTASVREVDTVARLGGDSFAIILLESDTEGGRLLAERVIQRFTRHLLPGNGSSRTEKLSASVGAVSFPSDSFDKADLLAKARRALDLAKAQGGGCVRGFQDTVDPASAKSVPAEIPVRKIYDASRSVVDMDKFLEILLFTGMQGMSAGRGSIVVKDDGGDVSLRAAIGFSRSEEYLAAARSFHPGPITRWVIEHQLPLVVSGPADTPVGPPLRKNGYKSESFLSIPLTHRGRTFGALHLTNRKDSRPFTHEDLKAFGPIASEISAILAQGMSFRENVRTFSLNILGTLSDALELRFPFLSGHCARVRDLSLNIADRMKLDPNERSAVDTAASLHEVGIVGIPGDLLSRSRRLNEREMELVRKHPYLGAKMIEGIPELESSRRAILEHHEHFDGSGYPYGLRGDDISLPARILSVAEYFDAIVSARPHRGGLTADEALQLVRTGANTLFDPEVAQTFLETASTQ